MNEFRVSLIAEAITGKIDVPLEIIISQNDNHASHRYFRRRTRSSDHRIAGE